MKVFVSCTLATVVFAAALFLFLPERTSNSLQLASELEINGTGSLSVLFDRNISLVCNYAASDAASGALHEGTMYYDAPMERYHIRNVMTLGNQQYQSGIIRTQDTVYSWSETPEGVTALRVPLANNTAAGEEEPAVDTVPNSVTYDCREWVPTANAFEPPTNIEFMTSGELLESALQNAG